MTSLISATALDHRPCLGTRILTAIHVHLSATTQLALIEHPATGAPDRNLAYCVYNEPLAPLTLREVCRWWYSIVDNISRLWQTVPLNDAYGGMFPEQQAALWTTRSQPFEYNIELNIGDPQTILPLISPFLSSIDRWKSFRFTGSNRDDELLPPTFRLTQENLTHLHLCLHDNDQEEWDDDESRITFSPISPEDSFNYAMNLWVVKLPSPLLLSSLRFVHVTIAEGGIGGLHAQPNEILGFLTACPELESFFLSGFPHDGPIDRPLPIVRLPNLITLQLKAHVLCANSVFN